MPQAQLIALILFAMPVVAMSASASDAKSAITEYFVIDTWAPKLERSARGVSLEICFDTCDFYEAAKVQKESDLWDLAFLHQYYIIDNVFHLDDFRRKYASLAEPTLKVALFRMRRYRSRPTRKVRRVQTGCSLGGQVLGCRIRRRLPLPVSRPPYRSQLPWQGHMQEIQAK